MVGEHPPDETLDIHQPKDLIKTLFSRAFGLRRPQITGSWKPKPPILEVLWMLRVWGYL